MPSLKFNMFLLTRIEELSIESSKRCVLDHVTLYDGRNVTSPVLFGPACGELSDLDDDVTFERSFVTSSSSVLVVFETDEDVSGNGFAISYAKAGQKWNHFLISNKFKN